MSNNDTVNMPLLSGTPVAYHLPTTQSPKSFSEFQTDPDIRTPFKNSLHISALKKNMSHNKYVRSCMWNIGYEGGWLLNISMQGL